MRPLVPWTLATLTGALIGWTLSQRPPPPPRASRASPCACSNWAPIGHTTTSHGAW
jgi:hypothetical protein